MARNTIPIEIDGETEQYPVLTEKETRFVEKFLELGHPVKACVAAGYSEKSAHVDAYRILHRDSVKQALSIRMRERMAATNINREWIVDKLVAVVNRSLVAEPVLDRKGEPTGQYAFDSAGANKALETLAKMNGLLNVDKTDTNKDKFALNIQIGQQVQVTKSETFTKDEK